MEPMAITVNKKKAPQKVDQCDFLNLNIKNIDRIIKVQETHAKISDAVSRAVGSSIRLLPFRLT